MRRLAAFAFVSAVFAVFVVTQLVAMLSNTLIDGESSVLTNVVIEYARSGRWHYPLHAHHLFYPGVDVFMLHPPLHYFAASMWIKAFGVGNWQFLAQSVTAAIVMMGLGAVVLSRIYDYRTAAITLTLGTVLYGFYFCSQSLRPDLSFGAMYTLFLVCFARATLGEPGERERRILSLVIGLLATAALATHWNGYFVQLYLPVYAFFVIRRWRASWKLHAMLTLAGMAIGFSLWSMLFGVAELGKSLVFALLQGAHFMSILESTYSHALLPYTTWPGGYIVVAGIMFFLSAIVIQAAAAVWRGRPVIGSLSGSLARRVDLFLLINVAAYVTFYTAFVSNRNAQYNGNLYFLLLPLAARGYVMAGDALARWAGRPRLAHVAVPVFVVAVLFTSPQVKTYAWFNVPAWRSPNVVYSEMRDAFRRVLPPGEPVILGGGAYPYLYDSDYRSTMLLAAESFLEPIENPSFITVLKRHFKQRGSLNPATLTADDRRQSILRHADVMIVMEHSHSWQDLYYDLAVWERDYIEVATVMMTDPEINRAPMEPYAGHVFPKYATVYVRSDRVEELAAPIVNDTNRLILSEHVGIFVFDPLIHPRPRITNVDWNEFDEEEKRAALESYFERYHWFGGSFDEAAQDEFLTELLPQVDYYMRWIVWGDRLRSLGQATDYAIAQHGLARFWREQTAAK